MSFRKIVTTAIIAAMFFWAPAVIPVRAYPSMGLPCGVPLVGLLPLDTAYADGTIIPCPPTPTHGVFPWPVLIFGLGVTSVIVNSIYVGHTQCRELSYQEAWTSALLPFIGIAFNQLNDQCNPPPHHHHHS